MRFCADMSFDLGFPWALSLNIFSKRQCINPILFTFIRINDIHIMLKNTLFSMMSFWHGLISLIWVLTLILFVCFVGLRRSLLLIYYGAASSSKGFGFITPPNELICLILVGIFWSLQPSGTRWWTSFLLRRLEMPPYFIVYEILEINLICLPLMSLPCPLSDRSMCCWLGGGSVRMLLIPKNG